MNRKVNALALLTLVLGCEAEKPEPLSTDTGALASIKDTSKDSSAAGASALEILETYCYTCHGLGGSSQGGFDHVLDIERLVETGKIIPGEADSSPLFVRMAAGEMPPAGIEPRLNNSEVKTIRRWINLDLTIEVPSEDRDFVSTADEFWSMREDLEDLPPNDRRFMRYLSLTHLYNADVREEELKTYRLALSTLINRLSWSYMVVPPVAIDAPRNTLYRIDLRDYAWDDGDSHAVSSLWDTLIENNPYAVLHLGTPHALEVVTQTRTPVPVVRGDWFAAKAGTAPLYYTLLQIPEELSTFESEFLLVDTEANIDRLTAVRSGFNESGVSTNNRIIERHNTVFGAYWKSYDFSASSGVQNIFDRPLGPGDGPADFEHAGGEMIFELPNGLHGYVLTDGAGFRIDTAPVAIVSDPEQPDRAVIAGLSCMSCHQEGLISKDDEIRDHVVANADLFSRSDLDRILALYVASGTFQDLINADKERYARSIEITGGTTTKPDPTRALVREFEAVLDRKRAAVELGLTEAQLENLLLNPDVGDLLSPLKIDGGTIKRVLFNAAFNELACVVGYGFPIEETEDCDPPDYQGHRVDARLDVTRTAQTRTEPLPARLEDD
jgi:mono/diheme cytochrome c family protein